MKSWQLSLCGHFTGDAAECWHLFCSLVDIFILGNASDSVIEGPRWKAYCLFLLENKAYVRSKKHLEFLWNSTNEKWQRLKRTMENKALGNWINIWLNRALVFLLDTCIEATDKNSVTSCNCEMVMWLILSTKVGIILNFHLLIIILVHNVTGRKPLPT